MKVIEVIIPHCYLWMTEHIQDRDKRAELFNKYVEGYVMLHYHDLNFVRVENMKAICERKDMHG